jgi:glycosyltransferase involved in cell wall biosynthesis
MRIFHLIYDHIGNPWVGGGGAVRALEIYKRLAKTHHITIVCGKYPGATDYEVGNLRYKFVGTDRNNYVLSTFSYALRAMRFLHRHKQNADIVIEDFAPYNPLLSKLIVHQPIVLQIHHREGMQLFHRYSVLGVPFMLVEFLYPRLFRNIICVSEESRKKFNIQSAAIIPNGIDQKLFEARTSDGDYIAYIGRIQIHNKGLDTLVEAMTSVSAKLAIAGKGKDEARLRSLIEKSDAADRIALIGYLREQEKTDFLANSKVVIVPSRYEGQGIVVLEAAACGKPVIVSDIPELKYAVDAGFALSFQIDDAKDLTKKIVFLLENEPERKEMGLKAREYAKDFTWDWIAKEYETFLSKVIEDK